MPFRKHTFGDYLCLIYAHKVKELKRITMRCSAVIMNPLQYSDSDRVCFTRPLRDTCYVMIKGYDEQALSICNTLVKPVLALPAPPPIKAEPHSRHVMPREIRRHINRMRASFVHSTQYGANPVHPNDVDPDVVARILQWEGQ